MIGMRVRGTALLLIVAVLAGCSSEGAVGTFEGTVTFNGQPLEQGMINFVPLSGNSQPTDAPITAGKYTAKVPVGEFRVEFRSPKVIGQTRMYPTPDSPVVDQIGEALPAKYQTKSDIKLTVTKGKMKPQNYNLVP